MMSLPRGKTLLVLAVALTMLLFSGLVVGGRIRDAIGGLEEQQKTLTAERDRLAKINDARADYENQTRRFDEAYEEMTAKYPARITQNNQILFLRDVEDEFDIRIASASYTDPEALYRFQYLAPGNEEGYQLVRSTLQFPMSLSYEEWKRFIAYIEETDGREVIESVSADYDGTGSLVDVDVTILQYAITGADRKDAETVTEVEAGTDNIFSSGASFYTGGDGLYGQSNSVGSGTSAGYSVRYDDAFGGGASGTDARTESAGTEFGEAMEEPADMGAEGAAPGETGGAPEETADDDRAAEITEGASGIRNMRQ